MSSGRIVQIIGAVIDVEFPRDSVPNIYDAVRLDDVDTILEVQQQLGDGVVRTIAMGTTEGLKRGMSVTGTGEGIKVPVGEETLGRIMNVLGEPTDEVGDISARKSAGPSTVRHRDTPTRQLQKSCWKPASRLLT